MQDLRCSYREPGRIRGVQALFFGVEEKEMSIIEQAWLDLHAAALAEQGKAGRSKLDRAHPYPVGTGPAGQT